MSEFPKLREMGVENPREIEKFAFYTVGNMDILRIVYDRKKGSLLPISKRYKFPQAKKSVLVDSGTRKTETLFESSGAFREALHELEKVIRERKQGQDVAAQIREEIRLMQEDIALRMQYIETLLGQLKA